jgi:hypothetical protein
MQTYKIERKTKSGWKQTAHTREGKNANQAVCQFVVSRQRGRFGEATAKSGVRYRAVAA